MNKHTTKWSLCTNFDFQITIPNTRNICWTDIYIIRLFSHNTSKEKLWNDVLKIRLSSYDFNVERNYCELKFWGCHKIRLYLTWKVDQFSQRCKSVKTFKNRYLKSNLENGFCCNTQYSVHNPVNNHFGATKLGSKFITKYW